MDDVNVYPSSRWGPTDFARDCGDSTPAFNDFNIHGATIQVPVLRCRRSSTIYALIDTHLAVRRDGEDCRCFQFGFSSLHTCRTAA